MMSTITTVSAPVSAPTPTLATMSEPERVQMQRRNQAILFLTQMTGNAGISVAVSVGGPVSKEMLGSDTFAGSASACLTLGGAFAGLFLSNFMRRNGRRVGLVTGYVLALIGAGIVVLGIETFIFPLFLFGIAVFGIGQGTGLLARYTAADLAKPEERGRAISTLLFASTFGAVLAQVLVGWCEDRAIDIGLKPWSGPFLFAAVLLVIAAANTYARLRPDPLAVAGLLMPHMPKFSLPPLPQALRIIWSVPRARIALISMVTSQATMVAVMTMTPIHMRDHGHSIRLSSLVIALHIIGMFGLAPVVGRLSDRLGRLPIISAGAALLVAATIVTATAGYSPGLLFFGLFLLGLGWSGAMVSGTALLTDSIPAENRVTVQGSADLMMSLCGGAAAFSSGFIKRAWGYHMLSQIGIAAAIALLIMGVRSMRAASSLRPQT